MNKELYINDILIELGDASIALTFQVNDIAELKDRQANFSNRFKVPKTGNNCIALGFANLVDSAEPEPYRKNPARYVEDGVEIISRGYAVCENSEQYFNITIYSGNADFFELLGDNSLSSLDLSDLDHEYRQLNIVGSWSNTEGYIYPLIDYADKNAGKRIYPIGSRLRLYDHYLLPAVYVKTLIDKIQASTGYVIEGDIFTTDKYNRMILPFSREKFQSDSIYREGYEETLTITGNHTLLGDVLPVEYRIWFWEMYEALMFKKSDITVYVQTVNFTDAFDAHLEVRVNDVVVASSVSHNFTAAFQTFVFTIPTITDEFVFDGSSDPANLVELFIVKTGSELGGGSLSELTVLDNDELTHWEKEFYPRLIPGNNSVVEMSKHVADMTQKDLIKDLCNVYGLIPIPDAFRKIIKFVQFKEIASNKTVARDWTSKHDLSTEDLVEYRIGKYAQVNNLKYTEDESNDSLTIGNGKIIIDDQTIPATADLFTLKFAGSEDSAVLSYRIPRIRKVGFIGIDSTEFTTQTKPRIMLIEMVSGVDVHYFCSEVAGVTSAGTSGDMDDITAPIPYFKNAAKSDSLAFDAFLLQEEYNELIAMLNRLKKVTAKIRLTSVDIEELDQTIPVFLAKYQHYFYLNKVVNYTKGKATKCELIKI